VAGRSKRLNLKFNAQDIVEAIGTGNVNDGDVVTLHLTGYLYDDPNDTLVGGEAIFGEDAVLIIGKPKPKHPEE
jgi:predicted transcriptional regulator